MNFEIYECSQKAKAKIAEGTEDQAGVDTKPGHHRTKYPFAQMHIGQAFAVPMGSGLETSVRTAASIYAKKAGKGFTIIKHSEAGVLEVARIK